MPKSGGPENERARPANYVARIECRWRQDLKITDTILAFKLTQSKQVHKVNNSSLVLVHFLFDPVERFFYKQKIREHVKYDYGLMFVPCTCHCHFFATTQKVSKPLLGEVCLSAFNCCTFKQCGNKFVVLTCSQIAHIHYSN